jgi:preprotein translocase subunit Sec61beta
LTDGENNIKVEVDHALSANICIVVGVLLVIAGFFLRKGDFNNTAEVFK